MRNLVIHILWILSVVGAAAAGPGEMDLTRLVKKVSPAVVTVVTYNLDNRITGFGSGFFINNKGHLITNHHVLADAFAAAIKTIDGDFYPVTAVIGQNKRADIVKVIVKIPAQKIHWIELDSDEPAIAERIITLGSPMGLEQTVSEGIISAVRIVPDRGRFYQMSAPISRGSSGGPVINMAGNAIGVSTFMMMMGQNLNFAVSAKEAVDLDAVAEQTVSQWTLAGQANHPRMAEQLCRKGYVFSIDGKDVKALDYYLERTREEPDNSMVWHGLGYCYNGMNRLNDTLGTYQKGLLVNPDNALLHFHLGKFYVLAERLEDAEHAYLEMTRLDPGNSRGFERLGTLLARRGELAKAVAAFQESLRISPDDAEIQYRAGMGYYELGKYEDALKAYKKALELKPDMVEAHNGLGILFMKLDQHENAKEAYKNAIRIDPEGVRAHYNLGMAFLLEDNKAAALSQYKVLKELDEDTANLFFESIY